MQWQSSLHWAFRDEYVLVPFLHLTSFSNFLIAGLLAIIICLLERLVTFTLDKHQNGQEILWNRTWWSCACLRFSLYWIATFLRLCYMLIAMTFNIGLILLVVTTLAVGQFFIEVRNASSSLNNNTIASEGRDSEAAEAAEPLLHRLEETYPLKPFVTRPRCKSKPDDIFIHPANSNIARADAFALELGLSDQTQRVQGHNCGQDSTWGVGKGRDMARELLGSRPKRPGSSESDSD